MQKAKAKHARFDQLFDDMFTVMMAKIFNMRKEDVDMVTRQVFLNESVRADLNLVLKIIQRIPRATIKIQRQEVEMCLIVLLT